MKLWYLRGLFQSHPPGRSAPRCADFLKIVQVTMLYRSLNGESWPEGAAEEIADLMKGHPDRIAIRIAERELLKRCVGGPHTFAHGSGI